MVESAARPSGMASVTPPAASSGHGSWLVLATDGPGARLCDHAESATIRILDDAGLFATALLADRPRLVICTQPPASREIIDLVTAERRRRPSMRAVHLSPPGAVIDRLNALEAGFDEALTTTTPVEELSWRLGWLASKAGTRSGSPQVLAIGQDLQLDLVRHELRRNGQPVHLRPKEFGLLALMASHPGRSFTRRELLARVWGTTPEGGGRTVDVHVRWLRSKIEPDPDQPVYLVTVRGVGYRLDGTER